MENRTKVYLLLILLLAAVLRFWGMDWGLPYQYQSEEYKVIKYALKMGGGDLNPHFFEYPSLYLYFMLFVYGCYFLVAWIFGAVSGVGDFAQMFVRDPSCFYLIGRALEGLFGLGTVWLTYIAGRKMFSTGTGLVAALMVAVLPEYVNKAHYVKGDLASIFLGLLFWILCLKIYESGKLKYYLLAGITLGLAVSTKYYLLMFGIALPVAHWLSPSRNRYGYCLLSLLLIPVFFLVGTPYAVLSREFLDDFGVVFLAYGKRSDTTSWNTYQIGQYLQRLFFEAGHNLVRLSDFSQRFLIGGYGMGILSLAGIALLFFSWEWSYLLVLSPILAYLAVVGGYHNPAAGYFAPIFPLFLMVGAHGVNACWAGIRIETAPKRKLFAAILAFTFFALSNSIGESALISYSYCLKDTRTIAKEWIESNIPPHSKVLMDILVNSPPLEHTKAQIEHYYQTAVKLNHYKKDYFKLKLEVYDPQTSAYNIYVLKRQATELGVIPKRLEEVQQVQDLVEILGEDSDFTRLQKSGIEYVIVSSYSENDAKLNHPRLAQFYADLPQKTEHIYTVQPLSTFHPGPSINIYKIHG